MVRRAPVEITIDALRLYSLTGVSGRLSNRLNIYKIGRAKRLAERAYLPDYSRRLPWPVSASALTLPE